MPSVQKVDCQLFIKRLRYMIDKHFSTKVRYFLVAEYGGKKGVHITILFCSLTNL